MYLEPGAQHQASTVRRIDSTKAMNMLLRHRLEAFEEYRRTAHTDSAKRMVRNPDDLLLKYDRQQGSENQTFGGRASMYRADGASRGRKRARPNESDSE